MPVATTSSGRALYDHASTAFIRNMPLEALLTITKAIQTGHAGDSEQLAEQFLILRITALCAVYCPNDPEQIRARWQTWSQANAQSDDQNSLALSQQLQLQPTAFLASVWTQTLRFYAVARTIPLLEAKAPNEEATTIAPASDTLLSALQLPASVVEALILGALKIDEDLARSLHVEPVKRRSSSIKTAQPGVQAARSICEWLLSAHSELTTKEVELSVRDQMHLYDQHRRVLRLYSLDVLGVRQNEWEYAGEMVRCAKLLTEGQAEIDERSALLNDIIQAQASADTRVERLQAAKDRAKRIMSDQLEKKKQDAVRAQEIPPPPRPSPANKTTAAPPKAPEDVVKREHRPTPDKGVQRFANGKKAEDQRSPATSEQPDQSKTEERTKLPVSNQSSSDIRSNDTIGSLRSMLNAWLRHFGGATGFAFALLAVLLTIRRGVTVLRSRVQASALLNATPRARLYASTHHATNDANRGLIGTAWQKMVNTIRMGTQVTYL